VLASANLMAEEEEEERGGGSHVADPHMLHRGCRSGRPGGAQLQKAAGAKGHAVVASLEGRATGGQIVAALLHIQPITSAPLTALTPAPLIPAPPAHCCTAGRSGPKSRTR
jgi:hypothetical protein